MTGLPWRAVRHHYEMDLVDQLYVITRPRGRYHGWQVIVGRRTLHRTDNLGDWPSFAVAERVVRMDMVTEGEC